jgi:DNA-binding transcriptional regulator YdaS (Cro superfamily)
MTTLALVRRMTYGSQVDAARALGVSLRSLQPAESGRHVSASTWARITRAIALPPTTLATSVLNTLTEETTHAHHD